MRIKSVFIFFFFHAFVLPARGQFEWSTPVQVTSGPGNDLHPAIADAYSWSSQEECLAFSRDGKMIGVIRTADRSDRWSDSVYFVTNDSADNDFPTLARDGYPWGGINTTLMILFQSRRSGNLDILFSTSSGSAWSVPLPLTFDPVDDQRPHICPVDTGFAAVWERNGRIMFSRYKNGTWSTEEFVTPAGDTLNSKPKVRFISSYPAVVPMVLWQKKKIPDTTYAIYYSFKSGVSWSAPETLALSGDNRDAGFFKGTYPEYNNTVVWTIADPLFPRIMTRSLYYNNGVVQWDTPVPLAYTSSFYHTPAVNGFMVITREKQSPPFLWYAVATWKEIQSGIDYIAARTAWAWQPTFLSPLPFSTNRNPDITSGVLVPSMGFAVRHWSVWEGNATGPFKLWGSKILIIIDDVSEKGGSPRRIHLEQNYPNPFNPATRIEYQTTIKELVVLKVFDLLGREVATLVNEVKYPGTHMVEWRPDMVTSGAYMYRLQAGGFVASKKLLIIR